MTGETAYNINLCSPTSSSMKNKGTQKHKYNKSIEAEADVGP